MIDAHGRAADYFAAAGLAHDADGDFLVAMMVRLAEIGPT